MKLSFLCDRKKDESIQPQWADLTSLTAFTGPFAIPFYCQLFNIYN